MEPWNKLDIAFPSVISTVEIRSDGCMELHLRCFLEECEKVLILLKSKVLQTEIRIMNALLYVFHHRLRQHKPYRAFKQVEQCVNRLQNMRLEAAFQDIKEMCPKKFEKLQGSEFALYEVPSQPALEWFSLKVLGASKLMLSLMQYCSKAFLLALQHLNWKEFIILNVVLSGVLSRLWVFSRGILKTLVCLYEKMFPFLQDVSKKKERTEPPKVESINQKSTSEQEKSFDLGIPVSEKRSEGLGNLPGLDVKALFKRPCGATKVTEGDCHVLPKCLMKCQRASLLEESLFCKKESFVCHIKGVASFSDLTASIKEVLEWCKGQRLQWESRWLSYQHLKCQRLKHMEAKGYRFSRKLNCYRKQTCRILIPGESAMRKYSTSNTKWSVRSLQSKFQMKWKSSRQHSKTKMDLTLVNPKDTTKNTVSNSSTEQEDIDSIFASIGL
ncbi:nucleolus and neural progenitor protein isoform X2 [Lepisosteus oculatus]|uniref:nucleolus and neural progenitor protein isoform X2 n=1 Tax=Lepisosteus oculatus TaxID=7918 RepID=UPI00073FD019|nr:PREDICTED: protein nepro homolog isoform X2 [Lepisosteus oculatus]